MDSLRGIPVEYKLDAFNMPRTGTTLCHPKIGYVDLSVIPLSTRMEIMPTLPQIPDTKLTVTSKVQFQQLQQTSKMPKKSTTPHTSNDTRCHFNFSISISSQYSQPFTSLAAPKANPKFHAANKNPIHKNPFRLSPSYFFFILLLLFLTT